MGQAFSWSGMPNATGNFRYTQQSFDVNEQIAALGIVASGVDGFGQPCKVLQQIQSSACTPAFMEQNKWEDWGVYAVFSYSFATRSSMCNLYFLAVFCFHSTDKEAWVELCGQGQSVLVTDHKKYCQVVAIPKIDNLPPQMQFDANRDLTQPKFYAPMGANQQE